MKPWLIAVTAMNFFLLCVMAEVNHIQNERIAQMRYDIDWNRQGSNQMEYAIELQILDLEKQINPDK